MDYDSRRVIFLNRLIGVAAFAATALSSIPADATASNWAETKQTKVRLISGSTAPDNSGHFWLGLQFQMKPGWKIYWRSPGDAGFPPEVKWDRSLNLQSADIQWPIPLRFSIQGLETLGYKNEVVLPIFAKAIQQSETVYLKSRVSYLTCNDICIPYVADLQLQLRAEATKPSEHIHLIKMFRARVPGYSLGHDLKINALRSVKRENSPYLEIAASSIAGFSKPDVFIEGKSGLSFGKPTTEILNDTTRALINVAVEGLNSFDDENGQTLDNRTFKVTLVDGSRFIEKTMTARPGPHVFPMKSDAPLTASSSLIGIFLLAVFGGLILNLMPCVLPVLSIKVIGLIQHGGSDPRTVRVGFLAAAAGIISTFLILASVLAGLKAGGMVVGWGIQFQQPWFLISLTLLITIFACNLWGFFEFRLPQAISRASVHSAKTVGFSGHFLQGAFATILATPCSAPFVGTAVGFALTGKTSDIFLIFGALGLGLALPYLIFAALPKVATRLPKPGPWMIKLKLVLGFLLATTGIWLLNILLSISGPLAVLLSSGLVVTVGLVLYRAHKNGKIGLNLSGPVILLAFVIAIVIPEWPLQPTPPQKRNDHSPWQTFDETAIPNMVRQGKTIYVDVSADWCITCFTNKSIVFANKTITQLISNGSVIAMQADWTRPNDVISRYLARYNRYGIPFNIVYGPKKPDGVVLPEILTATVVLEAIALAAGENYIATRK